MSLLDLIEQHYLIGPPPHRLGERTAFVVADIAWRRADQPRDRVLLHVFRHVESDHGGLIVEQILGKRLGKRSEEHTSELQSLAYLVCRLLLEKKKKHLPLHYTTFRFTSCNS